MGIFDKSKEAESPDTLTEVPAQSIEQIPEVKAPNDEVVAEVTPDEVVETTAPETSTDDSSSEVPQAPPTETDIIASAKKYGNVILAEGAEPLTEGVINMGMDITFNIPNNEAQKKGFYVDNPGSLIHQFPGVFKFFKAKGLPNPHDANPLAGQANDNGDEAQVSTNGGDA